MKKYVILLVVAVLSSVSCETDDRAPLLMRATNDNFFFDAAATVAVVDPTGGFLISGTGDTGTITLFTDGVVEGNYDFVSITTPNYATYTNPFGDEFDSRVNAEGRGRITITNVNENARTVSGRFRFVAFNGGSEISFRTGVFEDVS